MTRLNLVSNSKYARLVMRVMIVLSLLAFSGSVSPNTDTRKPANREVQSLQKFTTKRSRSLQDARQHLLSLDFFRSADRISLRYSLREHKRLSRTNLRRHGIKKIPPPEIQNVIQLHAPRSAASGAPSKG